MERTKDRFNDFMALEAEIMDNINSFHKWYDSVVIGYEDHGTSYHDFKVNLIQGTSALFQVQITNFGNQRSGYCRYHDIRLDLISSFDPFNEEGRNKYHDFGWRWKTLKNNEELNDFASLCKVSKWGKLITCDADIFVFSVCETQGRKKNKTIRKIHLINLYDNDKLKINCEYFINQYGVKINHKMGEPWGSAFIPVDENDKVLNSCLVKNKDTFLTICNSN